MQFIILSLAIFQSFSTTWSTPFPSYIYNEIRLEDILANAPYVVEHRRRLQQQSTLPITLNFDDVPDAANVFNQYIHYGITFSKSAFGLKATYDGGCCGNFAGLPSGSSAMTLLKSNQLIMNVESKLSALF